MLHRLLAAVVLVGSACGSAAAQSGPPNPFIYTCRDFLDAQSSGRREVANLMVYWVVGYMHGRFSEEPTLTLDQAHHDNSVNDIVNALLQVCPNVPDLPLATFAANLAGDLQKTLQ